MSQLVSILCLLSTALAPVPAKKALAAPTGQAPTLGYLTSFNEARGEIQVRTTDSVPVTRIVTITEDRQGKKVTVARPVTEMRAVQKESIYSLAKLRIVDLDGKELPREETLKQSQGNVVLLLQGSDQKALDPTWASAFRADSIVILIQK